MQEQKIKIGDGGRIIIPAYYRKMLDVQNGDELVVRFEDGELRFFKQKEALQRIRNAINAASPQKNYLEEFINFRRSDGRE